jgi:hypothetical protein
VPGYRKAQDHLCDTPHIIATFDGALQESMARRLQLLRRPSIRA